MTAKEKLERYLEIMACTSQVAKAMKEKIMNYVDEIIKESL